MAVVSTQTAPVTGANVTYSSASGGGDRFTPGDRTFVHIKNGSGSSVTATFTVTAAVDGLTAGGGSRAVTVAAGGFAIVPVPVRTYQASDGLADVAWSATTSITFAVLYLAP